MSITEQAPEGSVDPAAPEASGTTSPPDPAPTRRSRIGTLGVLVVPATWVLAWVLAVAGVQPSGYHPGQGFSVDALRWTRCPPAGELLRGRMTVLGKDPVGDDKGIVIAQHDLLDEAGRLVFSCLTRSVFARL